MPFESLAMDSKEPFSTNPWARFLGVCNLTDIKYYDKEPAERKYVMKLKPDDMDCYGCFPMQDDLELTSCTDCHYILKPQALKDHIETRHKTQPLGVICDDRLLQLYQDSAEPLSRSLQNLCSSTSVIHKLSPQGYHQPRGYEARPVSSSWSPVVELHAELPRSVVRLKPSKSLSRPHPELLPEQSCSISTSSQLDPDPLLPPPHLDPSEEYNCSVLDPSSSTTEEKQEGRRLEKLVIRRVLQTKCDTSDVGSSSLQKGVKGESSKKKKEQYFMVVKSKDRQQNLLAARHQIKKQSDVVNQQKDKVDQKMKKLEMVRDKLITQLFNELAAVKQKLSQCNHSKSELHKELLAVREQLEETRKTSEVESKSLEKENSDYQYEVHELKEKIDHLTARTSNFIEHNKQECFCAAEKYELHNQLDELETELRETKASSSYQRKELEHKLKKCASLITQLKKRIAFEVSQNEQLRLQKNILEQHLPPEIRVQVRNQVAGFAAAQQQQQVDTSFIDPVQNLDFHFYQQQMLAELPDLYDQSSAISFDDEVP